jgi:hypothetical protein
MTTVFVYRTPTQENPDPNYSAEDELVIEIPKEVAEEGITLKHMIDDFTVAGEIAKIPIQSDSRNYLVATFQLVEKIQQVRGVKEPVKAAEKPAEGAAAAPATAAPAEVPTVPDFRVNDDQPDEKAKNDQIRNYIRELSADDGKGSGNLLIFNMLLNANFMDYKRAIQYLANYIANTIKGKTPDEIRSIFTIKTGAVEATA